MNVRRVRRQIDDAVDAVISRMGTYDIDNEAINDGAELNVEFRIDDDLYRSVEVTSLYICSDKERVYKNIEAMIMARLQEAATVINREAECDFIEGMTKRQKKEYYAAIA